MVASFYVPWYSSLADRGHPKSDHPSPAASFWIPSGGGFVNGVIYAFRNIVNGKHYIGQSVNWKRRKARHLAGNGGCSAFSRAIKKYGRANFHYEILVDGVESKADLDEWESYFIWLFMSQTHGYNITAGGEGMDSELGKAYAKQRLSNPEWRRKNAAHMKRLTTDPAWLKLIAERNREQSKDPSWIESNKRHRERMYADPVWIEKRRLAGERTSKDPTWREKMRLIGIQNANNQERLRKNREFQLTRARHIFCIELGMIFRGCGEAARFFGIDRAGFRVACVKPTRITAGFHWRYATKEEIEEMKSHE